MAELPLAPHEPVTFEIPGRPTSWKRTNMYKGRALTPKGQREKIREIRQLFVLATRQVRNRWPLRGPVRLDLVFIFPRPATRPPVVPREAWDTGQRVYRPSVPDRDNCEKLIADALGPKKKGGKFIGVGLAWLDDAQICTGLPVKCWAAEGEEARTIVRITKIGWLAQDLEDLR